MPPSQLKQLKTSLRDHGILGPQQSKKQKKNLKPRAEAASKLKRDAALQGIREQFNPFEIKSAARPAKFDATSNRPNSEARARPGLTKSLGEQRVCVDLGEPTLCFIAYLANY